MYCFAVIEIWAENVLFFRRSWLSITTSKFQKLVLTSQSKRSKTYLIMLFFFYWTYLNIT